MHLSKIIQNRYIFKILVVPNVTLNSKAPTLEKLRGHGFVDELRSSFHQSHSGVQVVVHHCNVKSRFAQSTWVLAKLANEELMLHQNDQRTKVFAASQPHLSQICWWRSSRAVSWCSLHYSFGPHRREECCLCWEERRRKNMSESLLYEHMGRVFFPKEHYLINMAVAETTAHSINSNTVYHHLRLGHFTVSQLPLRSCYCLFL